MFTFTHLSTGGQLDRQRQRDLLARADQQRLVRQLREHARTSRRTERAAADHPRAQAHPPSDAPRVNHAAAASSHPNWGPLWPP